MGSKLIRCLTPLDRCPAPPASCRSSCACRPAAPGSPGPALASNLVRVDQGSGLRIISIEAEVHLPR